MNYLRIISASIAFAILFFALNVSVYANPAHERLASMGEPERRIFFAKFLVMSGEKCSGVTKTFYQGSAKNGDAMWNAACKEGDSFVIQVINNATGSTRILNCKLLKAVKAGTCFTKFKG